MLASGLTAKYGSPRRYAALALQLALRVCLMNVKGYGAPEVERNLSRAKELCASIGDDAQLFQVLEGSVVFYTVKSEPATALKFAYQQLVVAERAHDPFMEFSALRRVGMAENFCGRFELAQQHLDQALAIPPAGSLEPTGNFIQQKAGCLYTAAVNSWILGYPERAVKLMEEAFPLARPHPVMYCAVLSWAGTLYGDLRDWPRVEALAAEYSALAIRLGFPMFLAEATVARGVAWVGLGRIEEGIAELRRGIEELEKTGAIRNGIYISLAERCALAGQVEEGFAALERVERASAADFNFLRIKGELLLARKPSGEHAAETCFRNSIEIARSRSAKSPELRATISLARLLAKQNRRDEARAMLSEIYGWFTEGFDTADLKDAKALLDELERKI
jgi:tetratricopeptide (TPR) repeat protein